MVEGMPWWALDLGGRVGPVVGCQENKTVVGVLCVGVGDGRCRSGRGISRGPQNGIRQLLEEERSRTDGAGVAG